MNKKKQIEILRLLTSEWINTKKIYEVALAKGLYKSYNPVRFKLKELLDLNLVEYRKHKGDDEWQLSEYILSMMETK